jgi:hypothetical protein
MVLYGWAFWQSKFYAVRAPEDIQSLECQVQDGVIIEHECSQDPGNPKAQAVRVPAENRLQSYLFNMVMGLMIVNRQWPWVLDKETHYDAYIGLDVLDHTAAFTFLYEGGQVCAMRDQESRRSSVNFDQDLAFLRAWLRNLASDHRLRSCLTLQVHRFHRQHCHRTGCKGCFFRGKSACWDTKGLACPRKLPDWVNDP